MVTSLHAAFAFNTVHACRPIPLFKVTTTKVRHPSHLAVLHELLRDATLLFPQLTTSPSSNKSSSTDKENRRMQKLAYKSFLQKHIRAVPIELLKREHEPEKILKRGLAVDLVFLPWSSWPNTFIDDETFASARECHDIGCVTDETQFIPAGASLWVAAVQLEKPVLGVNTVELQRHVTSVTMSSDGRDGGRHPGLPQPTATILSQAQTVHTVHFSKGKSLSKQRKEVVLTIDRIGSVCGIVWGWDCVMSFSDPPIQTRPKNGVLSLHPFLPLRDTSGATGFRIGHMGYAGDKIKLSFDLDYTGNTGPVVSLVAHSTLPSQISPQLADDLSKSALETRVNEDQIASQSAGQREMQLLMALNSLVEDPRTLTATKEALAVVASDPHLLLHSAKAFDCTSVDPCVVSAQVQNFLSLL